MSLGRYLSEQGFRSIRLRLSTEGPYSWRDSEWNYSDIPHLKHVHSQVESYSLGYDRNQIHNVFVQSFLGLKLPAMVSIYHEEAKRHIYYMQIANIVIEVKTEHFSVGENHSKTETEYRFYFKGIVGSLVGRLARLATKHNYKVLMSEDIPMRIKRGRLRELGYGFKSDHRDLIGFSDTTDIESNNMLIKKRCELISKGLDFRVRDDDDGGWTEANENCQLSCSVQSSEIIVRHLSCPHEGGDLCSEGGDLRTDTDGKRCKWHGRRLKELYKFRRREETTYEFECYGILWKAEIRRFSEEDIRGDRILIRPKYPDSKN